MENLNYPYLLAVHTLCIDGQLHQNELRFLYSLGQDIGIDPATEAAAELILAQADEHLALETVIQHITSDQYLQALSLSAIAAQFDGALDRTEQRLLLQLQQQWSISDDLFLQLQERANKEAERLISALKTSISSETSTGAKVLGGLETMLGKKVIDKLVGALGSESMKERIQDYRIEALLSGPKYDKAIAKCRDVGMFDIEVADTCLHAAAIALQEIDVKLENKIVAINASLGNKPAQDARKALDAMKEDHADVKNLISHELQELHELQVKKRRAMSFYTIAFMGRSKAGKSTLHAVVTGGDWDQIGVGRQNTTRLNRVYEWNNIRVIDTPGIATPGGEDLEKVAGSIIDEADLICFVVTNNNQQPSEFEFLQQLRKKGKPLLLLLNVKEDLSHPVRLKRFLDNPGQAFSDQKDRLGGHIDRIRRDAEKYYGTSNFPIIPVQLLAAQIAQQQPEHEHADALMKASRLQHFLDSVRLSLLDEGLLRRSQNLLGSTVADIEGPYCNMQERSAFYLNFSREIDDKSNEAKLKLKKAQEDHAKQLEQDLCRVFSSLQQEVQDFAEDYWDYSEDGLNDAWSQVLVKFGMEKKINDAQEKSIAAFSDDMKELLAEIDQELNLQRKLSYSNKKLDGQDSSIWFGKTLKWGSGLAGLGMAVAALANWWNPAGWAWGAVAAVGFIASFFESKASKKRKAVAKIANALESQIEKQEKQIVEAALKHFNGQCFASSEAVENYFRLCVEGLYFVGQTIGEGAKILQKQSDILNTHFAARILDFSSRTPSESSAQQLRAQIHEVRRKVGDSINIQVSSNVRFSKDMSMIESTIQEKIFLQKVGV